MRTHPISEDTFIQSSLQYIMTKTRLNALIKDTIADYESHFMGFEPATSRFKPQIYNNYTTESILNMIHAQL